MGIYMHEKESFVTKKALSCNNEDLKLLGIEHSLLNINLTAIMMAEPESDSIAFEADGKTYWFDRKTVEDIDTYLKYNWQYKVACTAILLNSPRMFGSRKEEALLKKVIHPDYEWDSPDAYISAFPMYTEDGRNYFRAFVEFLSWRYMRDDAAYGRITGFIVSNEVNSQCVWGNAGEKTAEDYAKEYTLALYTAWEAARKYWDYAEVFMSLDHFWTARYRPERPLSTYRGRDMVDFVLRYSEELGGFGWGIAYHPYPEDLHYPDFYNDRIPTFYFNTPLITFKNMEVLHAYMGQEKFLWNNKRRPIVFSEQGFNSRMDSFSEMQGAASYTLAYQKMKKLPGVLWMTHHAYLDNLKEFGLHLGIRERNEDGTPGRKRPIYDAIADMGTIREKERAAWAMKFIGEDLYLQIENPVIYEYDQDMSEESDF